MIKFINDILHWRVRVVRRGKTFVYWKKVKFVTKMLAPAIYCPYIPLTMIRNFTPSLAAPYIPETPVNEQDLNHGTTKESRTKEEGNNPES